MIWDKLNNIELECVLACPIVVTHTESSLEFTGVPRSGFEYSIDMNDAGGTTFQSINSSILYELYSLSYFNHIYTAPGNYNVAWSVSNGGYSKTGNRWIVVENEITNFQVAKHLTVLDLFVFNQFYHKLLVLFHRLLKKSNLHEKKLCTIYNFLFLTAFFLFNLCMLLNMCDLHWKIHVYRCV
jgi:hypothetical protein